MKCPSCPRGVLISQTCEIPFTRGTATVVVQSVPAQVCTICRAEFVEQHPLTRALELAEGSADGHDAPLRTPGAVVMSVVRWRA